MAQNVAILVPGITGSFLVNKLGVEVWPYQVALNPKNAATLLADSSLTAGAPIQQIVDPANGNVQVYSGVVNYFKNAGYTYTPSTQSLPSTTGNVLVGFGYDWRQSNVSTAALLGQLIASVVKQYAGCNVWLVAHSMGGLVSRYLLESGISTGAAWRSQLKGLVTFGTPHLGAPLALSAITGECDVSKLLNPNILKQVVDLGQYPSGYELLPPEQVTFTFDGLANGYDIYKNPVNAALVSTYGAVSGSFADALKFFGGLDYTSKADGRPPYYVIYGTGLATTDTFSYASTATLMQQQSDAVGDSIVPQFSGSFGTVQPVAGSVTAGWVSKSYAAPGITHTGLVNDPASLGVAMGWINGTSAAETSAAEPGAAVPAGV